MSATILYLWQVRKYFDPLNISWINCGQFSSSVFSIDFVLCGTFYQLSKFLGTLCQSLAKLLIKSWYFLWLWTVDSWEQPVSIALMRSSAVLGPLGSWSSLLQCQLVTDTTHQTDNSLMRSNNQMSSGTLKYPRLSCCEQLVVVNNHILWTSSKHEY